jgi:hypothetical protein
LPSISSLVLGFILFPPLKRLGFRRLAKRSFSAHAANCVLQKSRAELASLTSRSLAIAFALLTPGNSSSCANESIPSLHHRAKTTPLERSIWFPCLYLTRQRKRDDSLYFLRKQHLKRDEDGYLYTSRHIRVLFAYFLAQKSEVLRLRQRNVYYRQDGWAFVFRRLQEQIERTAEFQSAKDSVVPPVDAKSISPVRGNHKQCSGQAE